MRDITSGPSHFERLIESGHALPAFWRGMTNAQALAWLRGRLGLTQLELGRMAGVAQSRISKIEAGGDALLSTWTRLFAAMGLGLRLLPAADAAEPALRAARRRFSGRDHRQVPRPGRRRKIETPPPP